MVLIHDNGAADGKPLPAPLAYLLGGEERVENAISNAIGNAATGVLDLDTHGVTVVGGPHPDHAPVAGVADHIADGVSSIDEQVQEHLVEIAHVAHHWR